MTTTKFTCKVNKANAQNNSIRCTIPKQVVSALNIAEGDTIKWIITEDNNIIVEKLIL
jgi:bifunctional DNA-binding transcriptional regulator/antitoxin component of YhaV-PrlF toxin-antitoxin module